MLERLQKIMSARGISSRRKAEEYLLKGLVKVNGRVAKLGQKADPLVDSIEVDGQVLVDRAEMLYYVMNKPIGVETKNVEGYRLPVTGLGAINKNRKPVTGQPATTVRDLLPPHLRGKIFPIGRLDKDSSGLLLFTNDGVLAYRLTHPKFDHEKEYEVVLDRPISPMLCRNLEEGCELDGVRTKPVKIEKVAPNRVRFILTEGKNRQIRRMCQFFGFTVKDLRRVRIMNFTDDRLPVGSIRALRQEEKLALLRSVGV